MTSPRHAFGHEHRHPQGVHALGMLVVAASLIGISVAEAALTTDSCLVKKRQAWSALRKCQAAADLKRLKGKPFDLAKCQAVFEEKHAKVSAQAAAAGIACRFGANGDATVTDYDTGLMWEGKDGTVGGICFLLPDRVSHCVNSTYTPEGAHAYVSGNSADGVTTSLPFLAGHTDWRLPTITELRGIFDATAAGCGLGAPCIDPIFGPTSPSVYRSSTVHAAAPDQYWLVVFGSGQVASESGGSYHVRAVRSGL